VRYVNLKLICKNETVAPVCECLVVVGVGLCCFGRCFWVLLHIFPPIHLERASQLGDGVGQVQDLRVHLVHQGLQLVNGVQNLDALGVRVEAHLEGTRHGADPATELVLGILEALGHVVDGLVLLVLVGLHGRGGGLEGTVLALVADGMEQLAVGAQESSAVGLDLTVFLAETELNSEPVDLEIEE